MLNSKFNIDRDLGLQLRHTTKWKSGAITREKFALSQGEGRNVTSGNLGGLQYTARFEWLPFGAFTKKGDYSQVDLEREQSPKLMIAYTYNLNQDAVKTRSGLGSYMELADGTLFQTDITTTFVDLMFKYSGISFMGEYASRFAENPVAKDTQGNVSGDIVNVGSALNLQAGYLFKNNNEIAIRFTQLDFDPISGQKNTDQYTVGFSRYLVGHFLKLQSDFSYSIEEGKSKELIFRSGFELHF